MHPKETLHIIHKRQALTRELVILESYGCSAKASSPNSQFGPHRQLVVATLRVNQLRR